MAKKVALCFRHLIDFSQQFAFSRCINHFKGTQVLSPPEPALADLDMAVPDLLDIKGQETAKRALEVASNLLK